MSTVAGENNPRAKLQTWQVALIRRVHAERIMSISELAEEFGVARGTVKNICSNCTWKTVKGI